MTSADGDDGTAERAIDRLPDWLVSNDEDDRVVSERVDRALRLLATYLP